MGKTMKKLVRICCVMMTLAMMLAIVPSTTVNAAEKSDTTTKKVSAIEKYGQKDRKTCKTNAQKYGWTYSSTVTSKSSKKLVTEMHFKNSEWSMTIKQVTKKNGSGYTKAYYQGKKKIAFSGIARTLKKYSDA